MTGGGFFYSKLSMEVFIMTQSAVHITNETISVYPYILKLSRREDLTFDEMYDAFDAVLEGRASDSEIASLLMGLKEKGETVEEITALVTVLKDHATKLPHHIPGVIDNCGTGGDGSNSFNISTTSAFVIAGAGVRIAKHGNKRSEEHTSELQSRGHLVCRLLLE